MIKFIANIIIRIIEAIGSFFHVNGKLLDSHHRGSQIEVDNGDLKEEPFILDSYSVLEDDSEHSQEVINEIRKEQEKNGYEQCFCKPNHSQNSNSCWWCSHREICTVEVTDR